MEKLNNFAIQFRDPDVVFLAGEHLHGHVIIELGEAMKMKGVTLTIKGKAKVAYKLAGGDGYTEYTAKEEYFRETRSLCEPEEMSLAKGTHTFDFSYSLPETLPPSYEGEYGSVRYSVLCAIERPWETNYTAKELFSVTNILDLNLEKSAEDNFHEEANKEDGCCFCYDNGDVTVSLDLPRLGYVPGEHIPVTAEIKNSTSGFVRTSLHLLQTATFTCPSARKPKVSKEVVGEIAELELDPHSKFVFSREKIAVSSIPPSRLEGCGLIDIAYQLKLKACTDYSGVSCKVVAPIIIGTLPLQSQFRKKSSVALPEEPPAPLATDEEDNPAPRRPTLNLEDYPPPVFEDCVSGTIVAVEEGVRKHRSMSLSNYIPKYAVYKF